MLEIYSINITPPKKKKKENNTFYKASITLTPKPDMDS